MSIETGRVYNEDCLETMNRMDECEVDLVLTDPPYGNNWDYDEYNDTRDNLKSMVGNIIPEIKRVSDVALITTGVKNLDIYMDYKPEWVLNWTCPAGTGSGEWGFACWQPVVAFGTDPYLKNGKGSRPDTLVKQVSSPDVDHPCPKPREVWNWLMKRGSVYEEELVYDPFFGSGTTGLVAEKLNRQWIGSEISEEYCELARNRIKVEQDQQTLL